MIDTPPTWTNIFCSVGGFLFGLFRKLLYICASFTIKKTFNMEELIKKIQNAVQNNGGEIRFLNHIRKERPVIQWLGVVSFEIHSLNSSGVDGEIGVGHSYNDVSVSYEKMPQDALEKISKAIDKIELVKQISQLVFEKNNSNLVGQTTVYLNESFMLESGGGTETLVDRLAVDYLTASVYDMSGETPEHLWNNVLDYFELDYATLEEIRIRLEEM